MEKYSRFLKNKFIIWIFVLTVIFAIIGIFVHSYNSARIRKNFEKELFNTIEISIAAVNPDRIKKLSDIEIKLDDLDYARVKDQLQRLGRVFSDQGIDSVYIMKIIGEEVYFLVDSFDVKNERYSAPNEKYLKPPSAIASAWNTGNFEVVGPYTDEYGTFISCFAPIKNFSTGEQIGIIGVDVDYKTYQTKAWLSMLNVTILFWGTYILTVILILYLRGRSMSLRALYTSEEKYRLLVENSHDIIYTLSLEGVFMFVSNAWTELLGHKVVDVVGKNFREFVHLDDVAAVQPRIKKIIDTGEKQEGIEYRVKHKDGSWKWHTTNVVALKNEKGNVVGAYGISRDITKQKEMFEQTAQLNKFMVGRELKMVELKKKIQDLEK